MGTLLVIDSVEEINLCLEFLEVVGKRLCIEEPEQSLMEAFVFALRSRFEWFPSDRFHAERSHICGELTYARVSAGVERGAVIGEELLRYPVSCNTDLNNFEGIVSVLRPGGQRCNRVPRVVVKELEDHTPPAPGQDILRSIKLPATIRGRIHEPAERSSGPLLWFGPRDSNDTKPTRQRSGRWSLHTEPNHFLVHTDRAMVEPGTFECASNVECVFQYRFVEAIRAVFWLTTSRLECRGRAIGERTFPDLVERVPRDFVFLAEGRDCASRGISGPLRDREADTRIDGRIAGIHSSTMARSVTTKPGDSVTDVLMQNCHRCPET